MNEDAIDTSPPPDARRNFILCVANGGLVMMGAAFFSPGTVLAALAQRLTGSTVCVGLLVSLGQVGFTWPQLFAGNLVEPFKRKMPVYAALATSRALVLFTLAA
ncbi:MAG: hypothetical protein JXR94_17570, partial [Candidatus Hydrogenedentes bacterium]|nr:hypothetical protein [Candidatus Hydrogenedentota bacterium]